VSDQSDWAPGSDRYRRSKRRLSQDPIQDGSLHSAHSLQTDEDRWRFEDTGITWDFFDVDKIRSGSVERSRHRFRAHLPELIWNTAALEGNNFTLPEVKTLLEGVTVGGKKLEDEQQIIALSEAYNLLDEMVGTSRFSLSKDVSDQVHRLVARHEAIEAGSFPGGSYLSTLSDARQRALIYFASATRRQFYFDGNKRTARLMMTGELMSSGYDIVSVPYSRRLEFNIALDVLFDRDDATELLRFLTTCTVSG
jgi:hypothetical protein